MIKAASLSMLAAGALALGAAQPAMAGEFHGVVAQGPLTVTDYQRMGTGNVGSLRHPVVWRDAGPGRWGGYDAIVGNAGARGVPVLPVLIGPGPAGTTTPPTSAGSRRAFARFAGAVAARYGPGGDFWRGKPYYAPVRSIQIYNEQNGHYWGARANPKAYGKLVKASAKAIRREARGIQIVLGGMYGTPRSSGAMTSWSYLKKLYRVRGVKRAFDTVAIHPYSPSLRGIKKQIGKIRRVLRTKDRRAKLRITEAGWGSASVGLAGQAQMLKKLFGLLERKRRAWKIVGVDWFAWKDKPAGVPGCSFCSSAGLFYANGTPKPAWSAFTHAAS